MRLLIAALALIFAAPCIEAQAVRFDSVSYTTNASCVAGKQCGVLALPGTQVSVCQGSQSTLAACLSSLATTYTDAGAGTPCSTTSQLTPATGGACLSTSDNEGNFGFWALPGNYSYYLRVPATAGGGTYGPYPFSVHGDSGGYTLDSLYATLALGCTAAGSGTLAITRSWNNTPTQTLGCKLLFLGNGLIKAATSATLTINPEFTCGAYQQCFDVTTNSGASIAFTGASPALNPVWLGADWTGVGEALPSFNAAYASTNLVTPSSPGIYNFKTSPLTMVTSFKKTVCSPGVTLEYTGSATVAAAVILGDGSETLSLIFSGCTIVYNSHASAGLFANHLDYSTIDHLTAFSTSGNGACFSFTGGNSNTVNYLSGQGIFQGPHPCTQGLLGTGITNFNFTNLIFEEVLNEGISLVGSSFNTFNCCTSEGNGIGIRVDSTSANNTFTNVASLVNSTAGIIDGGIQSLFTVGEDTSLINITSTAIGSQLINIGGANQLTIDAGAIGTQVLGGSYNNLGTGGITDNGTCTSIIHVRGAAGATNFFPDKYCNGAGTQNTSTSQAIGGAPLPTLATSALAQGTASTAITTLASVGLRMANQAENSAIGNITCATPFTLVASWQDQTKSTPTNLTPVYGTILYITLAGCALQAGGNNLNLNAAGNVPIYGMSTGANLIATYGVPGGGTILPVFYNPNVPAWLVIGR